MSSDIAVNKKNSEELQNLQRTNEEQNEKISECERQILENEGRILLGKRKDAKYQYKYKKKIDNIQKQQFQHNVGTYINRLK